MSPTDAVNRVATSIGHDTVEVRFNGVTVARTSRPLVLAESNLPPVYYVPLEDVDQSLLTETDHVSRCPFKGEARYWSITVGDRAAENAVWNYPTPIPEQEALSNYVAFYPGRVDEFLVNGQPWRS